MTATVEPVTATLLIVGVLLLWLVTEAVHRIRAGRRRRYQCSRMLEDGRRCDLRAGHVGMHLFPWRGWP